MTRAYNEKIRCTNCQHEHTAETDFERWMRNHPDLDSINAGIVRFDLDVLIHKYKLDVDGKGTRDIQCVMFIEVKSFMAAPSLAQIDTLSMLNQVLRNRRPNMHSEPRRQAQGMPTNVFSKMRDRNITLKMYGGHLLQFDGSTPETSDRIVWNNIHQIDLDRLVELILFERDPDNPDKKLSHRRRSQNWSDVNRLFRV